MPLLYALVAAELLTVRAGRFSNTPEADIYLVAGSPLYEPVAGIIEGLIWPSLLILAVLFFRQQVESILKTFGGLLSRISVIEIAHTVFTIGPVNVPAPAEDQDITLDNIALLHTSFVRPDKTRKFNDRLTYYQVEVVILARATVLDRIESVTYHLAEPYPRREYTIKDRNSRFKLKELANGASRVRAEVKIRDKEQPLSLNRFMNLQDAGPRI
jgi:hypothetical protein